MRDTENLFMFIFEKLKKPQKNGKYILTYQSLTYDLTPPWPQLSMAEAFDLYAKVDLYQILTIEPMRKLTRQKGYRVESHTTWEELFHQIYLNEVEPKLGRGHPTILYDFPSQMAALAKPCKDARFAERFEVFIGGLELGDCYSELTDWQEQERRFKAESEERRRLGKTPYPYDHDLIEALKAGLPECSGLALGVDRLIMLFADVPTIADTLFFPATELWN
jgi:elongation factor P--beta-lysine ligase